MSETLTMSRGLLADYEKRARIEEREAIANLILNVAKENETALNELDPNSREYFSRAAQLSNQIDVLIQLIERIKVAPID